ALRRGADRAEGVGQDAANRAHGFAHDAAAAVGSATSAVGLGRDGRDGGAAGRSSADGGLAAVAGATTERTRDLRGYYTAYDARDLLPELAGMFSDDELKLISIWKEARLEAGQAYVDLDNL